MSEARGHGHARAIRFACDLERTLVNSGIRSFDDYVIFGSAVMRLHGLRDEIGDVDVLVVPRVYAHLRAFEDWTEQRPVEHDPPYLETTSKFGPIHAFYAWASRDRWVDVPEAFYYAERVLGLMCVPLSIVAAWKREALKIVREWPCQRCNGQGHQTMPEGAADGATTSFTRREVVVCGWCGGGGKFRIKDSPWEKHVHDLERLEQSGLAA